MKIAQFKNVRFDFVSLHEARPDGGDPFEGSGEYVRISEFIEVEFTPMPADILVQQQLQALDREEEKVREKLNSALQIINQRRKELQALTHG